MISLLIFDILDQYIIDEDREIETNTEEIFIEGKYRKDTGERYHFCLKRVFKRGGNNLQDIRKREDPVIPSGAILNHILTA